MNEVTTWELRFMQMPPSNPFNAKSVICPLPECGAEIGQQCPSGGNHVERARLARWTKMGVIAEVAQD